MASPPWVTTQRAPVERPWMGMAMLVAVPLLSLVLIRMLWSGSGLWFLAVGLILLGVAAVLFLARRPQEQEYGRQALAQDANRVPLVLAGIGVLFLAMLLLPNFADGSGGEANPAASNQSPSVGLISGVAAVQQQPTQVARQPVAQQPVVQQPAVDEPVIDDTQEPVVPDGSQTYIVQDGDTLWDIALEFDTTVDAIIAANGLDNPADVQIDQELVIPPPDESAAPADGTGDEGAAQ